MISMITELIERWSFKMKIIAFGTTIHFEQLITIYKGITADSFLIGGPYDVITIQNSYRYTYSVLGIS